MSEREQFKIGQWVRLRTRNLGLYPNMMIVGPETPHNDLGYAIRSQRVFWLDNNGVPHEATLPVCALQDANAS